MYNSVLLQGNEQAVCTYELKFIFRWHRYAHYEWGHTFLCCRHMSHTSASRNVMEASDDDKKNFFTYISHVTTVAVR